MFEYFGSSCLAVFFVYKDRLFALETKFGLKIAKGPTQCGSFDVQPGGTSPNRPLP